MTTSAAQLWNDESGATMVEYGLMVALVAIVVAVAVSPFGRAVRGLFENDDLLSNLGG